MNDKLASLIEQQKAVKAAFQLEAQGLFKEYVKEFFETIPEIKTIKWTQYTPYFNDGDECTFSVHEPTFSNAAGNQLTAWGEIDEDEVPEGSERANELWTFDGSWNIPDELKQHTDDIKAFCNAITCEEMESVMRAMFDEHSVVTITRDGIEVEEYEHD